MPRIRYVTKNFGPAALQAIRDANAIIAEYAAQSYDLTLRQLYYQFVSRDLIPNRQSEYKRLGDIVNDARLAGLVCGIRANSYGRSDRIRTPIPGFSYTSEERAGG
jgi:hypothetical protein